MHFSTTVEIWNCTFLRFFVHLFDLNLRTGVQGLIFHRLFTSPDGKAETETVLSIVVLLRRDIGAAGKGGTEKQKRKSYYPKFFYCAEISWSRREKRKRKRYYPSLFYCAEISWSRRERRDGKAETETAQAPSPRAQVMPTLLSLSVYSKYKKPWVCFLYLP
jgi:hypothetical protein